MRVGVVCGAYHRDEVERMLEVVKERAEVHDVELAEVVWVPGAFEVPLACKRLLEAGLDGVVTLGILERGETQHGRVIGGSVTSALLDLQLQHDRPIGLGIIGPGVTPEQVEPRLVPHAAAALEAVVAMHR
jgi:6,7-dimethyl-8-ribityllumazine synthase